MGFNPADEYDFFARKHGLPRPPRTLDDVRQYFKKLKEGIDSEEPLAMEFGFRLSYGVCRPDVLKKSIAGKNVEDFVSHFLGGTLTSPQTRPSVSVPPVPSEVEKYLPDPKDFKQGVERAALEKTDLYFPTGLRLSLKSLLPDNPELNVGSFPNRLLFVGFLGTVPDERKGMGSSKRLLSIFDRFKSENKWGLFLRRFDYMVDAIFDEIHFLIIERDSKPPQLVIYTVESSSFRNLLKGKAEAGPEELTSVLYRFELHALRLKKNPVVSIGEKMEIRLPDYRESPLVRFLTRIDARYGKELLTGKIPVDLFKKEVREATEEFLEDVEKMLRKGIRTSP